MRKILRQRWERVFSILNVSVTTVYIYGKDLGPREDSIVTTIQSPNNSIGRNNIDTWKLGHQCRDQLA